MTQHLGRNPNVRVRAGVNHGLGWGPRGPGSAPGNHTHGPRRWTRGHTGAAGRWCLSLRGPLALGWKQAEGDGGRIADCSPTPKRSWPPAQAAGIIEDTQLAGRPPCLCQPAGGLDADGGPRLPSRLLCSQGGWRLEAGPGACAQGRGLGPGIRSMKRWGETPFQAS